MTKNKLQTLKGFRDFLPEKMAVRNEIIKRLRSIFEKYGFEELQTPALEYQEVLLGKYGQEAEKLMYLFKDAGSRGVGLRYDLTIPLARVVASNSNLITPFKAFRIQPVWRAEKPQKGRYRELYQCDFDIVGSSSFVSDAEIIAVINEVFRTLGFIAFRIRINSRQVLFDCLSKAKVQKDAWFATLQSIDKLDKKPQSEVEKELSNKGLAKAQIEKIFQLIKEAKPDEFLENTINYASKLGVLRNLTFDPTLVRGLDYYTGPIYEVVIDKPKIGSLSGGGRYDNLLKDLGGPNLPATGASIGLDRVSDVIEENKLWKELPKSCAKVLVTIFSPKQIGSSLEVASMLRKADIATEIYPDETVKIAKQLKYADRKNIDWAILVGPNEILKSSVVLKNLKTKRQSTIPTRALLTYIK